MKNSSSMHDTTSHSSYRRSSIRHSSTRKETSRTGLYPSRRSTFSKKSPRKLPLSGKQAKVLIAKMTKYNDLENSISHKQEKNASRLQILSKKLRSISENQYDTKKYRQLASQYNKALKTKADLLKQNDLAYKKYADANERYHSGLSANYHIKARELNTKIIDLEHKRDNLKENHNFMERERQHDSREHKYDYNLHHFGHSKEYGALADKIDRMTKQKHQLQFASESHRKLADAPILNLKSVWNSVLQK